MACKEAASSTMAASEAAAIVARVSVLLPKLMVSHPVADESATSELHTDEEGHAHHPRQPVATAW